MTAANHPTIDHQITFLRTRDLPASTRFYEEVMGLTLTLDQGHCRIYQVSANSYIGLCAHDDAPMEPGHVCYTIVTDQIDDWYRFLSERGATFVKGPVVDPRDNVYHFVLRDPNGYTIEFQQFLDPGWNG